MANMNKVFLMGNLTRDPELRYLQNGTAVADFGLAMNETYTKNGEKVEKTTFVDIEVWRKQAENCAEYLGKGSKALVEGALKLDQWETEDGQKRSKLKVTGFNVQFLGSPKDKGKHEDVSESIPDDDDLAF